SQTHKRLVEGTCWWHVDLYHSSRGQSGRSVHLRSKVRAGNQQLFHEPPEHRAADARRSRDPLRRLHLRNPPRPVTSSSACNAVIPRPAPRAKVSSPRTSPAANVMDIRSQGGRPGAFSYASVANASLLTPPSTPVPRSCDAARSRISSCPPTQFPRHIRPARPTDNE